MVKKGLILVGVIILSINFINACMMEERIFSGLAKMVIDTIIEFGEIESLTNIFAVICLVSGILIKVDQKDDAKIYNEEYVSKYKKYKWLRILGTLPFIGVIGLGIFCAFRGFSFIFNSSYGLEAFIESILLISIFIWPLYIIGLVIIIITTRKIKNLKKENNKIID